MTQIPLLFATLHYTPPIVKNDFRGTPAPTGTTEATEARNIFRIDQARLAVNISQHLRSVQWEHLQWDMKRSLGHPSNHASFALIHITIGRHSWDDQINRSPHKHIWMFPSVLSSLNLKSILGEKNSMELV